MPVISAGYMGHDEFSIVGKFLWSGASRFINRATLTPRPRAEPRKLVYKLLDTGSGWALRWSAL